jgi:hypothetical protein
MWTKIKNYFYTAWYEEYELTVWFDNGVITDEDGNEKPKAKTKKIFKLKSIGKRQPTHIKGKELDGKDFEIKTVKPFDFMLRKIY